MCSLEAVEVFMIQKESLLFYTYNWAHLVPTPAVEDVKNT